MGRAYVRRRAALPLWCSLKFSLYASFQKWDLFTHATFVRLDNFRNLFTSDPLFLIAVANTAVFTPSAPWYRYV